MSCLNKGQVTTDEALTGNYDCIVGVISLLIEPVLPAPPVAASAYLNRKAHLSRFPLGQFGL